MKLRTLTESDVTFSVTCEPEETPIEGNALASGDDAMDRDCEQTIRDALARGNDWAWCTIIVTASYKPPGGPCVHASDSLGCCNYEGEADFRAPGGYFDDMKRESLARLNDLLAETAASLPWEG